MIILDDHTLSTESPVGRDDKSIGPTPSSAPHRWGSSHCRAACRGNRWGVLLAGGDGTRLRSLTRFVCGDDRPKQFCPLIGGQTLLEQTRIRAERSIPAGQILVPVAKAHREFYVRESGVRPAQRIVQPSNKGTAPPILYSLLSVERNDRGAIVAILPTDHHYLDEQSFTVALESAFDLAAEYPDSVVLLGALPEGPEVEYGWIELGSPAHRSCASFHIRAFNEKPTLPIARQLFERGSLWNTFAMVGHVRGFLAMIADTLAGLVAQFRKSPAWKGSELVIEDTLYDRIPSLDFSREVLSDQVKRLLALRLDRTGWSDLGHPERVVAALDATGEKPAWIDRWLAGKKRLAGRKPPTREACRFAAGVPSVA